MTDLMGPLHHVDPAALARLHRGLEEAAARAGVLDVAYRTVDSPVGSLLLAATEAPLEAQARAILRQLGPA